MNKHLTIQEAQADACAQSQTEGQAFVLEVRGESGFYVRTAPFTPESQYFHGEGGRKMFYEVLEAYKDGKRDLDEDEPDEDYDLEHLMQYGDGDY